MDTSPPKFSDINTIITFQVTFFSLRNKINWGKNAKASKRRTEKAKKFEGFNWWSKNKIKRKKLKMKVNKGNIK